MICQLIKQYTPPLPVFTSAIYAPIDQTLVKYWVQALLEIHIVKLWYFNRYMYMLC